MTPLEDFRHGYLRSYDTRTDHTTDREADDDSEMEGGPDGNANLVINPVQLHLSYEDSQDVEIYHYGDNRVRPDQLRRSYEDSQDVEIYHYEDNRVSKRSMKALTYEVT